MQVSNALLVVAKQPTPGQAKTRLCPPLTPEQAADLYECLLRDTLELMRRVPGVEPEICYLPEQAGDYFRRLAPDMRLAPQRGDSLGARLDHALQEALQQGAERAVVISSDSPTLPAAYVRQAFERLGEADVVLGPTQDGGYYLIGMKQPQPRLLLEVEMSTARVLADTLELAHSAGLETALLPSWFDIDTFHDLRRLQSDLQTAQSAGRAAFTRGWLSKTRVAAQP